ncbi:MAG: SCO1664 family protein [Actinobacteria bacterium]|jgi:uncharacterized repeat protein (TIGR03843 family)|nr:SCO1664 family protein [Actinomycetota bacterium]
MSTAILEALSTGGIEVLGLLPYSSNYTFLVRVTGSEGQFLAVYKPQRGERPLWDFATGSLGAREVASYLVSEAAGWGIVPPTVFRDEGPLGAGSLQLFIEHDPDRHFFVLMEERLDDFRVFAAFDVVVNNADRKAGHVIEDEAKVLWAVDHGLTFHVESKLRTVIWQFADEPLGASLRSQLGALGSVLSDPDGLGGQLAELLTPEEATATLERVENLLLEDSFPPPGLDRPLPWPLV